MASANKFVLKGPHLEVDYTVGANPAFPALTYKSGGTTLSFKPADIETNDSGLGSLVSVAIRRSVDTGGERFGFFLSPEMPVQSGQTVQFKTVGVYEDFSGPNSVPHRPTTWRCVELSATAQAVIVPLETAAPV